MSSIALDIRVRPDRSDDLDDTGDDAGREAAARADGTAATAPDNGPPERYLPAQNRLR
ncbi:MAG: hypothetical protein HOV68_09590 [Streptomycetaceae bacterium]|nr:hypothetical protein [Streptomycetaceae bacterium]